MSADRPAFAPTPEQAEVVRHRPDTALCVAAAAGSGKTGTMAALFAARVAAGVPPHRLMAVSFTEKAAAELRDRIALEVTAGLAPEPASRELLRLERSWVGTFHQLALRLLREHAYRAGVSPELRLLDQVGEGLARAETLAALAAGREPGPGVLPYEPDASVDLDRIESWIEGAYDAMRHARAREASPAAARRRTERAHAAWEAAGHPPREMAAHRQALETMVALWSGYDARLRAANAVDFDGLLRLALAAVGPRTPLRRWCRGHFDCLIVDEFQDTSELQVQLLDALARPGWSNVVAVGDPRQAIYGWRDAAPNVMERVPGRTVVLGRNHRSRGPILAATDRLIRVDPLFANQPPVALHRVDEPGVPVWLGVAPDTATEAEAIAAVLRTVQAGGLRHPGGRVQAVAFRDCAVLAYTLGRLQGPLEEALRRQGVPYRAGGGALFERPEVQDLVAILRAATDPDDDAAWLRWAQGPLHRLPDAAILGLGPALLPLSERMRRGVGDPALPLAWRERMAAVLDEVEALARLTRRRSAARVVGAALEVSGLLRRHQARWRLGDPDGRRAVGALRELHRLCLSAELGGRAAGLVELLQRLDALAADERSAEPPPGGDEDAVTLLTVHRAKGLEFAFVILADGRPFQTPSTPLVVWDGADGGVLVTRVDDAPTQAATAWAAGGVRAAERAERRRVWYVGMTRARDALLVTTTVRRRGPAAGADSPEAMAAAVATAGRAAPGAAGDDDFLVLAAAMQDRERAVQPWPGFPAAPLADAARLGPVPAPPSSAGGEGDAPEALSRRWRAVLQLEDATRVGDLAERAEPGLDPVPRSAPLSFTQLEQVHRCPRQYWYGRLGLPPTDPVPPGGGEPIGVGESLGGGGPVLGVAVHQVLESVHRAGPGAAPTPAALAAALAPWARSLEPRRLTAARAQLATYRELEVAAWPTVGVEVAFTWRVEVAEGWVTVEGSIDRVARDHSGALWILDYKTGLGLDPAARDQAAHQLRLYAMAWQDGLGPRGGEPLRAAVVDLHSRRLREVPLAAADLVATRAWISRAVRRLRSAELQVGDAYPDRPCRSCAYRSACPERLADPPQGAAEPGG
ncbi:MAG TPA: ATP-dependent DNA helicase [Verrucomicrobiae bacterium]|nr:ATP-dependent DNA helicase [Verrucomicrobiae bacterium]